MASVTFEQVSKIFPDGTRAVNALDLEIADGEFMVLVGPSGCGKTTALRMVAGLEGVSEGAVRIGDRVVNDVEPYKRDIAMVFQNYALYPHLSVYDNIAFPLKSQRVPRQEIQERVRSTASLLGLDEHLKRRPRNLSGGQRQRVAMGRALVRHPRVFLMDEPLSNLDAKLRVQMRTEILSLQREIGVTTVYVTHDQVEAMTMGDRIAVIRKGVLQQLGSPQSLYDSPVNLFVAGFIGSPAMNLFSCVLDAEGDELVCVIGSHRVSLPASVLSVRPRLRSYAGREVAVGVRPEDLHEPAEINPAYPRLRGETRLVETLGREQLVHIRIDARPVLTEDVLEVARDVDAATVEALEAKTGHEYVDAVAFFGSDSRVTAGINQDVAFAVEELRFFDLDSGKAIAA